MQRQPERNATLPHPSAVAVNVDPCINILRGPSWPVMGIPLPFMHVCKVFCPEAGPSLDMHYQGSAYLSLLDKRKE